MTANNYREPGEIGDGATVTSQEPRRDEVERIIRSVFEPKDVEPAGVNVKALEWTDPRGDGSRWAKNPYGGWIVATPNGWGNRNFPEQIKVDGGLDEAMRAAEANHRDIILSCIEAGPGEGKDSTKAWIEFSHANTSAYSGQLIVSQRSTFNAGWTAALAAAALSPIGGEAEPVAYTTPLMLEAMKHPDTICGSIWPTQDGVATIPLYARPQQGGGECGL